MFEESEWQDEGAAPRAVEPPAAPPPAPRGSAALSRQRRQRLLATLRRLEGSARRPAAGGGGGGGGGGSSSSGSASDSEVEEQPARKRSRRAQEPGLAARKGQRRGEGGTPFARRLPGVEAAGNGAPVAGDQQKSAGATEERARQPLTRKQWRNRQKNKKRQKNKFKAGGLGVGEPSSRQLSTEEPPGAQGSLTLSASPGEKSPSSREASLRLRMEERLDAARFRYLNQLLYTCPSQKAAQLFQEDPSSFAVYHRGFARQVARWPESPVQRLVSYLRHRPASLVVADFGCGDCTLARSVRNKVHCFDLVALDPRVIVCDMAQVPLEAESVDVAVFCLALMGTNLREILEEASRVLRLGGTLLVAEVASRFPDVRAFVGALAQLGFKLLAKDVSGSHFYTFEFRKAAAASPASPRPADARRQKPLPGLALRPCLYKRR